MMFRFLFSFIALTMFPHPLSRSKAVNDPIKTNLPERNLKAKTEFLSPVHRNISLSGTFGELRPNHFHAGLDIKSANGRSGEPIYATDKGYISRIKISAYGYGRALYIQHPNGHMSVYGHLDHFIPELEKYILKEHYKRKRFELDLIPPPNTYHISQGQVIAYMGNTGSSTGPHLHFEIRNSAEEVINPLEYGIPLKDDLAPKIYTIKLYGQNQSMATPLITLPVNRDASGAYKLLKDTILVNSEVIAMSVRTYDQEPQNNSWLGVYGIKLYADDQVKYQFDMHALSFNEMRYSNAHRDYEEEIKNDQLFHRLFRLAGNKLPIYHQKVDDGWVNINAQDVRKIKMEVYDQAGNTSTLSFYLKQALGPVNTSLPGSRYIAYDQPYNFVDGDLKLGLPANILYSDIYFDYSVSSKDLPYSFSYKIQDATIPLHRSYSLSIKPHDLSPTLKKKAIIVRQRGRSWTNVGGTWHGDWLETEVNSFGNFAVHVDTEAPTIHPIGFRTNMKSKSKIAFKIRDNYGVSGKADELIYNAWIDDQWILMELDSKSDIITHRFDYRTKPGKHQVRVQVRDDRGNERSFVQSFIK